MNATSTRVRVMGGFVCAAFLFAANPVGFAQDSEIFKSKIQPFLNTYCVSCHGPKKAKDKIRLDQFSGKMNDLKESKLWHRVYEALKFGEMPSDKAK